MYEQEVEVAGMGLLLKVESITLAGVATSLP